VAISREDSKELDAEVEPLIVALASDYTNEKLRLDGISCAHRLRSRLIDLATMKADYSREYAKRETQARHLVILCYDQADAVCDVSSSPRQPDALA